MPLRLSERGLPSIQPEDPLLSAAERRILLADIARVALALGRQLGDPIPATPGELDGPADVSPLERLRRIEALWPRMTTALARLAALRPTAAQPSPMPTALPRARGGPETLPAIARRPGLTTAWLRQQEHTREEYDALLQEGIEERRAQPEEDTRDNRFVAALLSELARECLALEALAAFCAEDEEVRLAHRIGADIARWRRHAPYRDLKPPTSSLEGAAAGGPTSPPPYRALRACQRALSRTLELDWSQSPLLRLPAAEPWHLYEIWCFLQVAAALNRSGWRAAEGTLLRVTQQGLRLTLATGQASRIRFVRSGSGRSAARSITLLYRPYFRSADQHRAGAAPADTEIEREAYRSRTHAMQPDIALEQHGRLLLLDAKYKRYEPADRWEAEIDAPTGAIDHTDLALLADLDKMHAYRDAILHGVTPAVTAAWCLFPGALTSGPNIIAYPAGTQDRPFGVAQLGAVRLRPGESSELLDQLLTAWLNG